MSSYLLKRTQPVLHYAKTPLNSNLLRLRKLLKCNDGGWTASRRTRGCSLSPNTSRASAMTHIVGTSGADVDSAWNQPLRSELVATGDIGNGFIEKAMNKWEANGKQPAVNHSIQSLTDCRCRPSSGIPGGNESRLQTCDCRGLVHLVAVGRILLPASST